MNKIAWLCAVALFMALVGGCGGASDNARANKESEETSGAANTTSLASGTPVGEVVAEVELEPVDDSGTRGTATFREVVGVQGIQVELELSGLPKPGAAYYAQIHEGDCPNGQEGQSGDGRELSEDRGHEQERGGTSLPVAMVRLDRLLAKIPEEHAHSGHEHTPADQLSGKIDSPISLVSSADGTGSVTTLLEGVTPKEISSGEPKYLDLHAMSSDKAQVLACTDWSEAK
jgi:hypothetical protein